jgi:outer membrane protein assembly factor BamB
MRGQMTIRTAGGVALLALTMASGYAGDSMPPPGVWVGSGPDAGGYLLVATRGGLARFNANNGRREWRTPLEYVQSTSSVVVVGSTALVLSDFYLHAVDLATGKRLWTKAGTDSDWSAVGGRSWRLTSNGRLGYLDARLKDGVIAILPSTGQIVWKYSASGDQSFGTRVLMATNGFLFTNFGALSAETGRLLFSFRSDGRRVTALEANSRVIAIGYSDGTVVGLEPGSFRQLWARGGSPVEVGQLVTEGTTVALVRYPSGSSLGAFASEAVVELLNWLTGSLELRIQIQAEKGFGPRLLSVDADFVFAAGTIQDGHPRVSAFDRGTGRLRWSHQAAAELRGPAFRVGDALFVREGDNIVALHRSTGALRWRTQSE